MKAKNKMSYFISNTSKNNLSRPRKINELKLRCKHKMEVFHLFISTRKKTQLKS